MSSLARWQNRADAVTCERRSVPLVELRWIGPAFPETLPGYETPGYTEGHDILNTTITDAQSVAHGIVRLVRLGCSETGWS